MIAESLTTAGLADLSPQQVNAAVAIAIAIGTLYCFLGYRVLKFVIGLTGFLLAGSVAAALLGWLTHGNLIAMILSGVIGGISGAFALFFLYKAGVCCLGVLGGAAIAQGVLSTVGDDWVSSAVVAAAIFGGLAALFLERTVMTLATSAIGAWLVVLGLAYFILPAMSPDAVPLQSIPVETRYYLLIGWAVLAVIGSIAQFLTHKPRT
jgi:Domain of unknown function (DUF4203)